MDYRTQSQVTDHTVYSKARPTGVKTYLPVTDSTELDDISVECQPLICRQMSGLHSEQVLTGGGGGGGTTEQV